VPNKRLSTRDVVAQLRDGMTIGIGGWGARRKPMALVRELLRSPLRDLTVVSYGGPDVGLLCAAGKVRRLVFGFVSLDVIPLDPHFRAARQAGRVAVTELDEGMIQWGLRAAMLRLPFLPTRAGLASDVERLNGDLRTVTSPYDDRETLLAMPALHLDAALVHVDHADERGNAQILGPDPYFDELFCGAAKRRFVSCERIVPTAELTKLGCVHTLYLDRGMVDGVVEAPFGAHPTSCAPAYGIDVEHLKAYAGAAASSEAWTDYRGRYVDVDDAAYVEAVGGRTRLAKIPQAVF
jgi:glutaconate CoA-transferase subunit A